MSITERDLLLRMIQQLGDSIAKIIGLRTGGQPDEALVLLQQTTDGILGPMAGMIDQVDSASAAMLLASPQKVRAYAWLVDERAKIRAAQGDDARARADERRALDLLLLSLKDPGDVPDDVRAAIDALARKVDPARLDARARTMLESMGGTSGTA